MRRVFLLITLAVSLATGWQSTGLSTQQILSNTVSSYAVKATNLLQAAAQIASDFGVQMGVEWQGDARSEKPITREWRNATVEQIIYDTAAMESGYRVDISHSRAYPRGAQTTIVTWPKAGPR